MKVAQSCLALCSPVAYTVQNTGMGSLPLLQGIFPTQGLNPGLPHCRQILYRLSHRESHSGWSCQKVGWAAPARGACPSLEVFRQWQEARPG